MVHLKSTVFLLLIIAFPEANSISPDCGSNCTTGKTKEGENVEFWCQPSSGDGDKPVPTWNLSPIGLEQSDVRNLDDEDGGSIKQVFTWKVEEPVPLLVCYSSTEDENGQREQCETKQCDILYSPRNVMTSPQYSVSPGENITCTADGNPPPTFTWQESSGDGSWTDVDGADGETITAELKDGASFIELRCVAMNSVNSENSDMVVVSKYGKTIRTVIIVCVVVGVVVVGVISGVIYKVKGGS